MTDLLYKNSTVNLIDINKHSFANNSCNLRLISTPGQIEWINSTPPSRDLRPSRSLSVSRNPSVLRSEVGPLSKARSSSVTSTRLTHLTTTPSARTVLSRTHLSLVITTTYLLCSASLESLSATQATPFFKNHCKSSEPKSLFFVQPICARASV